jgi:predicted adenine nucleotide alpha hydrolase (AANH) superfamily ATPase
MLHVFRLKQIIKKMKSELDEHRYYLERNVAQRTEYLTRHIEVLETCKLTQLQKKHGAGLLAGNQKDHDEKVAKFFLVNNRIQSQLKKYG